MASYASDEARWEALVQRNKNADGTFVYGVATTGIYCRPSCASKRPKRENVRFFDTNELAESANYRPCKRCQPDVLDKDKFYREIIVEACRKIAKSIETPTLQSLAQSAGYSPSYFHRLFKRIVGVTPKQYATAIRANRVRTNLQTEPTITSALYDAGYKSSSRFYESAAHTLGMQPSSYRDGGAGIKIRYVITTCELGWIMVAATEQGVCAVEFADDAETLKVALHTKFPQADVLESNVRFESWVNQILKYLTNPKDALNLPLDIVGTAFQQRVWQALREIPAGSPITYSQLAERIDKPSAVRAVAQACAKNKIAVAIPCHRVIRRDGSLGGYRWGVERKQRLLENEAKVIADAE